MRIFKAAQFLYEAVQLKRSQKRSKKITVVMEVTNQAEFPTEFCPIKMKQSS